MSRSSKSKPKTNPKQRALKPKSARTPGPEVHSVVTEISTMGYAALADQGDVEPLLALRTTSERLAYKWLYVAGDLGHAEADPHVATLLAADTGGHEKAAAHWELACAYLEGTDGLPVDLVRAKHHLERAFAKHDLASINQALGASYSPAKLLLKLQGDAWTVLQTALVNIPEDNPDADEP
jgi:hypothetical protein